MGWSFDLTPDDNDTNNLVGNGKGSIGKSLPRITIGREDRANIYRYGGAIAGGTAGFFIGGPAGAAAGAGMGYSMGDMAANQEEAQYQQGEAAKQAERARRESITREYGAREQAASMAFTASMRGGSNNAPGIVGAGEGSIGSNIGTSGTF